MLCYTTYNADSHRRFQFPRTASVRSAASVMGEIEKKSRSLGS